jgi:hypothetical protein
MRIEIFVVLTELEAKHDINGKTRLNEDLKVEIVREFGGLTETGIETGYWLDNDKICADIVKRWIIYADSSDTVAIIDAFAKRIKKITSQKTQLYTIDGKAYFI